MSLDSFSVKLSESHSFLKCLKQKAHNNIYVQAEEKKHNSVVGISLWRVGNEMKRKILSLAVVHTVNYFAEIIFSSVTNPDGVTPPSINHISE